MYDWDNLYQVEWNTDRAHAAEVIGSEEFGDIWDLAARRFGEMECIVFPIDSSNDKFIEL